MVEHMLSKQKVPSTIQPHALYPHSSTSLTAQQQPQNLEISITHLFHFQKKKREKLAGLLHQEANSFPLSGCPQDDDTGMREAQILELSDLISFLPRLTKIFSGVLTRCAPCESQMCLHKYRQQAFVSEPSLVSADSGPNSQMMRCSLPSSF